MPAGRTIGALWDERSQSYVALSRPFEVKARKTVSVPLERPSRVAHLVAQLQRPILAKDVAGAAFEIALHSKGRTLPPDLEVSLADRAYAVWYGLTPGPAQLRAETQDALLAPAQFSLSAGKIERLFKKLTAKPAWAVR